MRKVVLLLAMLCASQLMFAQATQGINYQAVLRDGNAILANTTVDVLLAIEDASGNILYEENHVGLTTDEFGLLNFVIGSGTPVLGTFDEVDWSQTGLQYESEVTFDGTIFSLGRITLQSVPQALFADLSDSAAVAGLADEALFADSAAVAGFADEAGFADSAAVANTVINFPALGLDDLSDVTAGSADLGEMLIWDGSEWVVNQGALLLGNFFGTVGPNGSDNAILTNLTSYPEGGALAVLDSSNNLTWLAAAGVPGAPTYGFMEIFGANSNVNVTTFGLDTDLGFVGVGDTTGTIQSLMEVTDEGDGAMVTFGPNGSVNAELRGADFAENSGRLSLYDENDNELVWLSAGSSAPGASIGRIETYGPNGTLNAQMFAAGNDNSGYIAVADSSGNELTSLEIGGSHGQVVTRGPSSSINTTLFSTANESIGAMGAFDAGSSLRAIVSGEGEFETFGDNGSSNFLVSSFSGGNAGRVTLLDDASSSKIRMDADSNGRMVLFGATGDRTMTMDAFANGRTVGIIDVTDGSLFGPSAFLAGENGDAGFISTTGQNGFGNVRLSSNIFGTQPNNGSVDVQDSTGAPQAGIYVDGNGDGIVFGDLKNFRTEFPNRPDKEIWYASLEGPEAAAYVRGTAQLVNGEAMVSFPDHFAAIASTQGMTVVLTPLSAASEGMAVIEKTATGFRVKELRQGTGTYEFDWEVKCVRAGYEGFEVVRDAYREQVTKPYQASPTQATRQPNREERGYQVTSPEPVAPAKPQATSTRRAQKAQTHRDQVQPVGQRD